MAFFRAVILTAILMDPEARSISGTMNSGYGHEREPLIRLTNLYRAFNAKAASGKFNLSNQTTNLGQAAPGSVRWPVVPTVT